MVWHHYVVFQFYEWKMFWYCTPICIGIFTQIIQDHLAIQYLPEKTNPFPGTNGNKIGSIPTIIPKFQSS
jgi:hypothetical protein